MNKYVERTNNHKTEKAWNGLYLVLKYAERMFRITVYVLDSSMFHARFEVLTVVSPKCWKSSRMSNHVDCPIATDVRNAIRSFKTSTIYQSTRCNTAEDLKLRTF
jgi:hypothetical protein